MTTAIDVTVPAKADGARTGQMIRAIVLDALDYVSSVDGLDENDILDGGIGIIQIEGTYAETVHAATGNVMIQLVAGFVATGQKNAQGEDLLRPSPLSAWVPQSMVFLVEPQHFEAWKDLVLSGFNEARELWLSAAEDALEEGGEGGEGSGDDTPPVTG